MADRPIYGHRMPQTIEQWADATREYQKNWMKMRSIHDDYNYNMISNGAERSQQNVEDKLGPGTHQKYDKGPRKKSLRALILPPSDTNETSDSDLVDSGKADWSSDGDSDFVPNNEVLMNKWATTAKERKERRKSRRCYERGETRHMARECPIPIKTTRVVNCQNMT